MPYAETDIRALLQMASTGRVDPEDRAQLSADMATLSDAALLRIGLKLEAVRVQQRCALPALVEMMNMAEVATARAVMQAAMAQVANQIGMSITEATRAFQVCGEILRQVEETDAPPPS